MKVDDDKAAALKKKRGGPEGLRNVSFIEAKADGYKQTFSLKDAAPEAVPDSKDNKKRISLGGKEKENDGQARKREKIIKWIFTYPEDSASEGMKNAALKGVTAKASLFAGLEDVKEVDAAAQKELEEQKAKINFPFTIGDNVQISKEPSGPYGLFTAQVVDIVLDTRQIVVIPNVEARESLRGDKGVEMIGNQLNDLEELAGRPTGQVAVQQPNKRTVYRLDKDVFGGTFSKIRGDLMKLVSQQEMDNP